MTRESSLLHPFFAPRSVAVVGASSVSGKSGNIIVDNLVRFNFPGAVYPINPKAKRILGLRVYSSLAECPEPPEVVVIAVPREAVPEAMRQTGESGARHAVIASAGFADTGDEAGLALDRRVREIAAAFGVRYMGPNSIGTINTDSRFITSIVRNDPLPAGPVSLFGQTGLFASGVTRWIAQSEPFGVAKIACLGNKNDVTEIDVLNYLADDPRTGVVGCYLEGSDDGRAFFAALKRTASIKPVIVLKGGTSSLGGIATASHTGTLAGDAAVFRGVLRQAGAVAADDWEDLFTLLAGFAHGPRPTGNRLGVISITGAGCVLAADAAERYGLELPELSSRTIERIREVSPDWAPLRNPLDIWSTIERCGVADAYHHVAPAVAADPNIDMLIVATTLFDGTIFDCGPLVEKIRAAAPQKTVATVLLGGGPAENRAWTTAAHHAGAATFPSLHRAVRVLSMMRNGANNSETD
jgi:acetyltransferase